MAININLNTIFDLHPNVGINNVKFGMRAEQVAAELGKPEEAWENDNNELVEYRSFLNITYSSKDKRVTHFGLDRKMKFVMFFGINVFHDNPDILLKKMMTMDRTPYYFLGSVFFMKLGITLTDLYDENEDDKAIAIFNHHDYDSLLPKMKAFTDITKLKHNEL